MQDVRFVLGSDPELFLRDSKTKELRSAIPVIPEGKGAGRPLGTTGNYVLHDNVLVEFNTKPAYNVEEFVQTIGQVLGDIQKLVEPQGLEIHLQASAEFPREQLTDEEAREFGCDPDFRIYPEPGMNVMPAGAARKPFRSAGGHLHIGIHEQDDAVREVLNDPYGKIDVVKGLDIFVGLVGVFLDNDPTSKARRELYGKAGSHRPKTYGVEYRACSPWWLASPKHSRLVYHLSEAALALVVSGKLSDVVEAVGGEDKLQEMINEAQVDEARNTYLLYLRPLLGEEATMLIEELEDAPTTGFSPDWKI